MGLYCPERISNGTSSGKHDNSSLEALTVRLVLRTATPDVDFYGLLVVVCRQ